MYLLLLFPLFLESRCWENLYLTFTLITNIALTDFTIFFSPLFLLHHSFTHICYLHYFLNLVFPFPFLLFVHTVTYRDLNFAPCGEAKEKITF